MLIVQARMTSERLPGKVLLPIEGKPMLEYMVDRLPNWREQLIIATTNDGNEAPIVDLCQRIGVRWFRGEVYDVLDRYYQAAKHFGASADTAIVRLTSDCPLIDQSLVTKTIEEFVKGDSDLVTLGPHTGYPRGFDSTTFGFELLVSTSQLATSEPDREHVTHGMERLHPGLKVKRLVSDVDHSQYRITVDEQADLDAVRAIARELSGKWMFDYRDIEQLLTMRPDLRTINSHVKQKQL